MPTTAVLADAAANQGLKRCFADCPRSFDTREITDAADSAEVSFSNVDVPGFNASRSEMLSRLACAREPLAPQAIARVHRVQALGSQVEKAGTKVRKYTQGA